MMNRLLQLSLRTASQGGYHVKEKSARNSLQKYYGAMASPHKDVSSVGSFKGHGMLAPFTAGWQSKDLNPLIIDRAEGSYVYDSNGKKYLDSLAGLWCTSLGGSESRLVDAATKQLTKLPFYHSFWNRTTKPSLDLARELLDMFTANKMAKVFFTNSGSEANDSQVKLVWYYNNALGRPNKKKFISRERSYHGSTLATSSLTGLSVVHQSFDLPAPFVLHTDCPHYWRYHLPGETEEEFSSRMANNLENLILKEGPDTIAAFIAEPLMGAGGVIPPPATYFQKIQAVLKKHDILLIVDEVVCGFGRTGAMFGCDKYGIKPDLVTVAKALSSAYIPIGAVLITPEINDVIHSQSNKLGCLYHGFTYSGHPVSCAVALEALQIYKERNIVEQVNKIAPKFQEGVKAFSNSPIIGEIRGTGLIVGTEFTDNKSPNDPFPPEWGVGAYFGAQCEKRGLLVCVREDIVMMSPPFIVTPQVKNNTNQFQIEYNFKAVKEIDRSMVTLVVATTVDPASINPAKALLSMPGWHPGPTLDGGIRSFINGDNLRLLEQDKFIIEEDDLDLRWEAATGETVAELFFLSRHAAVSNRPALTIHPIGVPHLKDGDVLPQGGRPGWAAPPCPRIGPWLILLKKIAESHNLVPEFEITLEATHHGPVTTKPTMFIEIGSTEEYWGREDAARVIAQLVWEGLGLGEGPPIGIWSSTTEKKKVLFGIGGGHYVPRHMDVILKDGIWVGHLLSGYSLPMDDPGKSTAKITADVIGGTWKQAIKVAFDATKEAFPGGEIIAHLDQKSFKGWQKNAIVDFLNKESIKVGKPADFC